MEPRDRVVNRVYSTPLIRSRRLRHRAPLFRSMAPATQIITSPFIHTNIYLGLTSHLGPDVSAVMTHLRTNPTYHHDFDKSRINDSLSFHRLHLCWVISDIWHLNNQTTAW
uniref:Uncharacterized protein n=1 Tax=Mesocestoides corti TaxID=53468 RepID=A0A5K3ERZ6_MESCO